MLTIIKIEPEASGIHLVESQSHRTENWMGDEYVEVPDDLVPQLNDGWCDLTIEDGVLTALTPTKRPGPEPEPEPEPTDTEVLNTLLGVTE